MEILLIMIDTDEVNYNVNCLPASRQLSSEIITRNLNRAARLALNRRINEPKLT
jgi:hypothetical protein